MKMWFRRLFRPKFEVIGDLAWVLEKSQSGAWIVIREQQVRRHFASEAEAQSFCDRINGC